MVTKRDSRFAVTDSRFAVTDSRIAMRTHPAAQLMRVHGGMLGLNQ